MLKGVNKNVIEISDTGNSCFERAILFVRPESHQNDSEQLRRKASDYIANLKLRPRFYHETGFWFKALKLASAAAVGAAAAFIFLQ